MSGSRWQSVGALGAALALALLAPISSASAQDAGPAVEMSNVKFSPTVIHVPAGGSVTWTNSDPVAHTVTADDGSFDSGLIDPSGTVSIEFDTPGTFQYYCQPHGSAGGTGMAATIIVDG
jgi:plastocyanin